MIYLNNAATSYPKPQLVRAAVIKTIDEIPCEAGRSGGGQTDVLRASREKVAGFIGCTNPDRVVFTSGATESLNTAIVGLSLDGAHVITTAIEHNSVLRPLHLLKKENRITLTIVPCGPDGSVESGDIEQAITPKTALIVLSHCSNVTGAVQDVASVCRLAHNRGIRVLIDASQSIGALPVNVNLWQADLIAFTAHKNLYGIAGIGCLYVAAGVELKPLKTGGTGVLSNLLEQPPQMPLRLEAGTASIVAAAALAAGIDFVDHKTLDLIETERKNRACALCCGLLKVNKVTLYAHTEDTVAGSMVNFGIEGMDPQDISYALEHSFGIVSRSGLHCAPLIHPFLGSSPLGTVRLSLSVFTTDCEIEQTIDSVGQLAQSA